MSRDRDLLIGYCVNLLETYRSDLTSVDEHLNQLLQSLKDLDESETLFLSEVFSGCVQFSSIIDVVVGGFYNQDGASFLQADRNILNVICYLALFRLTELGLAQFYKFVSSQNVNKMYKFLNFFLDEFKLKTWIRDEWSKIYDVDFVDNKILGPLLEWMPRLQGMLKKLKESIDTASWSKPSVKQLTVMKPFNITTKKSKPVLSTEPIPETFEVDKSKVNVVVKRTRAKLSHSGGVDVVALRLQQIKADNRRKAEDQLEEVNRLSLNVWKTDKSERAKRRMQEILDEKECKASVTPFVRPPPVITTDNIPIKLNSATIMREGRIYQKREEEELKRLDRLEAGELDTRSFEEWQRRMRKVDLDLEREHVEMLRLAGQLSREEAAIARQGVVLDNRDKAAAMKEQAERLMNEYMKKQLIEQARLRKLAEDVNTCKVNIQEVKRNLREYKAAIVQKMNEEYREMMRHALDEAERDMRQKMEIIQQIKLMEAGIVAGAHQKMVDLTETAGYGLLSEMSIAELRERLRLCKEVEELRLESIRDGILADKQEREELLLQTLQKISRHRAEMCKVAALRFEEQKQSQEVKYKRERYRSEAIEQMERKLEERRAERKREDERLKVVQSNVTGINKIQKTPNQKDRALQGPAKQSSFDSFSVCEAQQKTKSRVSLLAF